MSSNFPAFVEHMGVELEFGPTPVIPDDADEWQQNANAYTAILHYKGRRLTTPFFTGSGWKHDPTAADVLHSLISDAQSVPPTPGYEYSFEQWADDLGYDTDSRKAEKTYRAVVRSAKKTRQFLGNDFEEFAEAAQDY